MRRVFALSMFTFALISVRPSFAEQAVDQELSFTIQIHDYWHVPSESLERARAIVTAMYDRIGVRTEWTGVVQQNERHPGTPMRGALPRVPVAQVTVIILTPSMAARGRLPEGALGLAAVPDQGMGRIAYAMYERIRNTAARATIGEDDLLGFVMAHEIAHLLLPRGAHVDSGLMRGYWDVHDFRGVDLRQLGFSQQQASSMRATLLGNSQTLASTASFRR